MKELVEDYELAETPGGGGGYGWYAEDVKVVLNLFPDECARSRRHWGFARLLLHGPAESSRRAYCLVGLVAREIRGETRLVWVSFVLAGFFWVVAVGAVSS